MVIGCISQNDQVQEDIEDLKKQIALLKNELLCR